MTELLHKKESRDNMAIIQGLLMQNYSIDYVAELMCEHKNRTEGFNYWQRRILMLIKKGLLRA